MNNRKLINYSCFSIHFSVQENHNGKVCQLIEMIWTTQNSFESGKKFCLTKTTGECRNGFFPRKILVVFKKTKTSTWHECRRLCDEKEKCDYFKWKVNL